MTKLWENILPFYMGLLHKLQSIKHLLKSFHTYFTETGSMSIQKQDRAASLDDLIIWLNEEMTRMRERVIYPNIGMTYEYHMH